MRNEEIPSVIKSRPLFIIFLSILFFIGIGLIMYSDKDSESVTASTDASLEVITTDIFSEESYMTALEKKLTDMINSLNGVSNVKVMITLKSTSEKIYASKTEEKTSQHKKKTDHLKT